MAVGNIQTRIGANQVNAGNNAPGQVRQRISAPKELENSNVPDLRENQIQNQERNQGFRIELKLGQDKTNRSDLGESRLNQPLVGRNQPDRQIRNDRSERTGFIGIREENALLNTSRNRLTSNRLEQGFSRQEKKVNPVKAGVNRSETAQIRRIEQKNESEAGLTQANRITGQTLSPGNQIGANLNVRS